VGLAVGRVRVVKIDDEVWPAEAWDVLSCGWMAVVMAKNGPSPRANMEGTTPEGAGPTEAGPGGDEVEVDEDSNNADGGEFEVGAGADSTTRDLLDQIDAVFLLREPVAA